MPPTGGVSVSDVCVCVYVCGEYVCVVSVCVWCVACVSSEIQAWLCFFFLYREYTLPWGFFRRKTLDACPTSLSGLGGYCCLASQSCGALSVPDRPVSLLPNDRDLCGVQGTGLSGLLWQAWLKAPWRFCGLHSGDCVEPHGL